MSTAYIDFDESMVVSMQKDIFLSTRNNKSRFIEKMRKHFLTDCLTVTAIGDTSSDIVKCAVEVCLVNMHFLLI